MSNVDLTPLTVGFNALDITSEERELLYNNLVIPAKNYNLNVVTGESNVRVFKQLNLEVFVLKVLENNQLVINQLAASRNFYKNKLQAFSDTESLLILNNGLIVKGSYIKNAYGEDELGQNAYIQCLHEGIEVVKAIPASSVVLVNTSLTADELAKVTLFEYDYIMSSQAALLDNVSRTRSILPRKNPTHPHKGSGKRP